MQLWVILWCVAWTGTHPLVGAMQFRVFPHGVQQDARRLTRSARSMTGKIKSGNYSLPHRRLEVVLRLGASLFPEMGDVSLTLTRCPCCWCWGSLGALPRWRWLWRSACRSGSGWSGCGTGKPSPRWAGRCRCRRWGASPPPPATPASLQDNKIKDKIESVNNFVVELETN